MAIVYRHRRLDTNEVFYVGIGKFLRRAYRKDQRNQWWTHIANKADYKVELLESDIPWEDACELEVFLIQEYGRKDLGTGCLVNMTNGGEGAFGRVLTEEHKRKVGEGQKARFPNGNMDNLSKAWEANKGRRLTEDHKNKLSKEVVQKTLKGEVIREFKSGIEAKRMTGINHINSVCSGHRKTAGGYKWEFKNKNKSI